MTNVFRANDSDKAPIKNIADPTVFGLLFITVFIFDITGSPGTVHLRRQISILFRKCLIINLHIVALNKHIY